MVTSSSPLAGFACVARASRPTRFPTSSPWSRPTPSAVGAGAFVSEILDPVQAEELRRAAATRANTAPRPAAPRRVGWFDAVATRYGCMMQGATEVALTNIDVLGYLDEIRSARPTSWTAGASSPSR